MNVKISKRFVKDTQKITDQRILTKIRHVLIASNAITALSELPNVSEMSGYPNFFRIKFDYRYRIGVYCDSETLEFLRVGKREDFYKNFP